MNWEADNLDIDKFKNLYIIQVDRLLGEAIKEKVEVNYDSTPWGALPDSLIELLTLTEPGERDQHREWKGDDPRENNEMGWGGGATPEHLQGGPRQGVRR